MTRLRFLGLELAHPVINAAGTWDPLAARRVFGPDAQFPFSLFVTPTLWPAPRAGDPPPRTREAPAGLVSATGRPGPGADAYLEHELDLHAGLGVPLVVSIGAASAPELAELVRRLETPRIAALELDLAAADDVVGLVQAARAATAKPVVVKLPATFADPRDPARAAAAAGADALTLVGRIRGAPAYPAAALTGRHPELSGPAVRPLVLAHLHAVADVVDLPLVAVGGVQRGADAAALLDAGATLVGVGTESFRDPGAGARIAAELGTITPSSTCKSAEKTP